MDNRDRPNLEPYALEELEVMLHEQDKRYWQELRGMQVSADEVMRSNFRQGPEIPRRPCDSAQLSIATRNLCFTQRQANTHRLALSTGTGWIVWRNDVEIE